MSQDDTNFVIKKDNKYKALLAIKALYSATAHRAGYSWVDDDEALNAKNLEDALQAWRWEPAVDVDGNINHIEFVGEKLGDDEKLFKAIALAVENDSYIVMHGEDGCWWRWHFEDGECQEQYGEIVWK
jgi:hypothetical protein